MINWRFFSQSEILIHLIAQLYYKITFLKGVPIGHGIDENGLDPVADTSPQVEEVPSPDDENVSRF